MNKISALLSLQFQKTINMKSKKKLTIWIWNPKDKESFDPNKSSLTKVIVECTFKRVIPGRFTSNVEYSYIHPRLNKKMTGITTKSNWEV